MSKTYTREEIENEGANWENEIRDFVSEAMAKTENVGEIFRHVSDVFPEVTLDEINSAILKEKK